MQGKINIATLQAAGRPATNLKADLSKTADDPGIHIAKLQANLADGDLSGGIDLTYPETGPSKYDLNLVLRDMDIQQILNNQDARVHGRLTGSLILGGAWNDVKDRRGHGDVRVNGQAIYGLPVMLGMLRMINLGLPVSKPFTAATARYNVDGQIVNLEKMELSSKDMIMSGTGILDLAQKASIFR